MVPAFHFPHVRPLIVTGIVLVSVAGIRPSRIEGAVPAGFTDALIATVASPTAIAFTPDNRLLITTQSGVLRVLANGNLLAAPALDLGSTICTDSERGLLGVAVDPSFASNGYIYLFYTFKSSGVCSRNTTSSPVNRVSRFTLTPANTVSRSSEVVLVDNIPSPNGNHNGGDLQFGADGHLYISVGDGGCDYRGDSGCAGSNDAARDLHVLLGKILRVTTGGAIPAGNPFVGPGTVRCAAAGRASPGQKCQETFAWGLRNPFRIAFDPNTTNRFFINDVGQNVWEEINEGRAGADYGWNVREGRCISGSATSCGAPPAGMTDPIYDYDHSSGCAAITGGAFVPNGIWPASYDGAYLFADYVCGSIFALTQKPDGSYTRSTFASGLGASSAVAMIFGPYGPGQALYYTTYAGGGQVRRLAATGNRAPTARAAATPRAGQAPLAVQFDATASSDPDGDTLAFEWSFGDGSAVATTPRVSHTYASVGTFTASVTVLDGRGGSDTASLTIDAGNTPPTPSIVSPSSTARFAVGQTITLTGSAADPEDGTLPNSRLSWTVLLRHGSHTHPYLPPTSGNGVTVQAPAPEDLGATTNSYLEIHLTATDSQGAQTTVVRNFQPKLVPVTFDTVPSGLTVTVNGTAVTTPVTLTSWEKYQLNVAAPTQRDAAGESWLFASWSNNGAASHTIVTPAAPGAFSAAFDHARSLPAAADAYVRAGAFAGQNFGTATTLVVKSSTSTDYQRQSFIRFDGLSGSVGRAVLRLRGALSSSGDVPIAAHPVASTSWLETAVTWNTKPPLGAAPLATARVAATAAAWHEWDVTAHVRMELAAGRTNVAFALAGTVTTAPYAFFSSRDAGSSQPELLLTQGAISSSDVVLHAMDISRTAGAWRLLADPAAAGGWRLSHPDAGAPKLTAPAAAPSHFFEASFVARIGTAYRLWLRGKADRNSYYNDSVYVQFSNAVTSAGAPTYRIGTTSAAAYVLEDCVGCGVSGWGWQDNGYGAGVLGPLIYFDVSGIQTIRIQTREDGLSIDQIVLSPARYLSTSPGSTKDDATIVPK